MDLGKTKIVAQENNSRSRWFLEAFHSSVKSNALAVDTKNSLTYIPIQLYNKIYFEERSTRICYFISF